MTEQKTYDFEGAKLVKAPIKKGCDGCFFENKNCFDFQPNCTKGFDENITNVIFIKANEPVKEKQVCPKCGHKDYEIYEELEYENGGDDPMYGGALIPVEITFCGNCG